MRPGFSSDPSYNDPSLKENLGSWGVVETLNDAPQLLWEKKLAPAFAWVPLKVD